LAILNDLVWVIKRQAIKEHSTPSELHLAHMRHFVLTASSNNSVHDGFGDHLGTMQICSWKGLGFLDAVFKLGAYISTIPLLPPTFKPSRMMSWQYSQTMFKLYIFYIDFCCLHDNALVGDFA